MKILILVPFGMEKDVYNIVNPFVEDYNYTVYSVDMLSKMEKILPEAQKYGRIKSMLITAGLKECKNFFNEDNVIWIGPCAGTPDKILCFYPDVVSAEEEMLKLKFNYESYRQSSEMYYGTNSISSILSKLREFILAEENAK